MDYAHAPHTRESTIFRQDNQTTGRQPLPARKDQPFASEQSAPGPAHSPAHAGINPSQSNPGVREALTNSPANAGIYPADPYLPGTVNPFPLARGNPPPGINLETARTDFPPYTRGSTQPQLLQTHDIDHSPSHAGICPSHNPRRNPARHIPPHTREPTRTRLPAP